MSATLLATFCAANVATALFAASPIFWLPVVDFWYATVTVWPLVTQLSHRSNTARMVSDHATECLIALLEKFQHDSYIRARVACALRNMSCHSGNLVKMVQAGASKWLIKMASDPNLQTQQQLLLVRH